MWVKALPNEQSEVHEYQIGIDELQLQTGLTPLGRTGVPTASQEFSPKLSAWVHQCYWCSKVPKYKVSHGMLSFLALVFG